MTTCASKSKRKLIGSAMGSLFAGSGAVIMVFDLIFRLFPLSIVALVLNALLVISFLVAVLAGASAKNYFPNSSEASSSNLADSSISYGGAYILAVIALVCAIAGIAVSGYQVHCRRIKRQSLKAGRVSENRGNRRIVNRDDTKERDGSDVDDHDEPLLVVESKKQRSAPAGTPRTNDSVKLFCSECGFSCCHGCEALCFLWNGRELKSHCHALFSFFCLLVSLHVWACMVLTFSVKPISL
jgi:hypothetical protein